jgi:hypothetical protein
MTRHIPNEGPFARLVAHRDLAPEHREEVERIAQMFPDMRVTVVEGLVTGKFWITAHTPHRRRALVLDRIEVAERFAYWRMQEQQSQPVSLAEMPGHGGLQ